MDQMVRFGTVASVESLLELIGVGNAIQLYKLPFPLDKEIDSAWTAGLEDWDAFMSKLGEVQPSVSTDKRVLCTVGMRNVLVGWTYAANKAEGVNIVCKHVLGELFKIQQ